jgi:hypothetical protein
MSSYLKKTKHPQTGAWETAAWLDDHFGHHRYGVKFLDGQVFNAALYDMPTTQDNVDDDWAKFFPESMHEALPSDSKPQEEVAPRSQPDSIEQQVEDILSDLCAAVHEAVYEGRLLPGHEEATSSVLQLIQQARIEELEQLKFKTSLMSDIPNRDRVSTQRIDDRLAELNQKEGLE